MPIFNYSNLFNRDTKLYTSTGTFSVSFLIVTLPMLLLSLFAFFILSLILNINMFNFLAAKWNWRYLLWSIILGGGSGLGLYYIKFSGYRLYEYLLAYLRPKKVYNNRTDKRKRLFNFDNRNVDTIIEEIL